MAITRNNEKSIRARPLIFVVDDEPVLLELAERVLSDLHCQIRTFTNPQVALQQYSSADAQPDVLITDFAMHEMNGLALIRACRRLNSKQKILMVSGTVDESAFADADEKPDRFLAKPYQPKALTTIVQELLKH